jgi:hypothetical protein
MQIQAFESLASSILEARGKRAGEEEGGYVFIKASNPSPLPLKPGVQLTENNFAETTGETLALTFTAERNMSVRKRIRKDVWAAYRDFSAFERWVFYVYSDCDGIQYAFQLP